MTELLPGGYRGGYLGGGVFHFPGKASTRTRLHELAHKKLGHEPGVVSAREFVKIEVDAEVWAWEAMGKKPNYRAGYPAYVDLIDRFDFSPGQAIRLVFSELQKRGIKAGKEEAKWYLEREV